MERWTIGQLVGEASRATSAVGAPASGRVSPVPDLRMIRYYSTLGLLDRPIEFRGRTALYSRRHLLQLVAIKRLQASGKTLVEIQQTLSGATDVRLAELGGAADYAPTADAIQSKDLADPDGGTRNGEQHSGLTPARARFWQQSSKQEPSTAAPAPSAVSPDGGAMKVVHLPLGGGATLVVEAPNPERWTPERIKRLGVAVDHLLAVLKAEGLILGDR